METTKFLQSVLGDSGHYCMFAARGDRREQKFYDTVQEVKDAAYKLDADGFDVYFALATFKEPKSRKGDNAHELKSLFLDLDCGPSKEYPTQQAAVEALRSFCKRLSLPKPTMINSGRGVHVYWVLTEAVSASEWVVSAEKLKKACAANGLLADPAVTSDVARILRVPNTHNYKDNPPLAVGLFGVAISEPVVLSEFIEKLGATDDTTKELELGPDALQEALNMNKEHSFKLIVQKIIAKNGCAQLEEIMKNQGSIDEPLWRAGLSITKFCREGEKAAISISEKHPSFSREVTLKKFEGIEGPYRCETFNELNPGLCDDCPHNISTPLLLGTRIKSASGQKVVSEKAANSASNVAREYIIPQLPKPYFNGEHGGIYMRGKDQNGNPEDVSIYRHTMYVSRRLYDQEDGELIVFRLHLPKDGVREFTAPLTAVTSREEFRKSMAKEGITASGGEVGLLMDYTKKWISELQQTTKADEAHRQFGWADDNMDSFVLGDKLIRQDKIEYNPSAPSTASLFHAFGEKGTRERHVEMLNFYNKDGWELHQFSACAGFGSVLMPFTGMNSLAIHLTGTSGVGKTTAQMMGLAAWGDPWDIMCRREDTHNSRMNRGEMLKNIPLVSDEMTEITPQEASEYLYQMTGGRQKNRMSQSGNAERYRGKPWELLAMSSANSSMWDIASSHKANSEAELLRLFEIAVPEMVVGPEAKRITDILFEDVRKNYGLLGVEFIQYIMKNKENTKENIQKLRKRLDEAADLSSKHRFWSAGIAATLTACSILNKLGIAEYNINKLFDWAVRQVILAKVRLGEAKSSTSELLNSYIAEKWNNILWIDSTDDGRISGDTSTIFETKLADKDPRSFIVARYEPDLEKLYLSPAPLKEWCVKSQINFTKFIDDLKKRYYAENKNVRLFKGTSMGKIPAVKLWVLNFTLEKANDSSEEG